MVIAKPELVQYPLLFFSTLESQEPNEYISRGDLQYLCNVLRPTIPMSTWYIVDTSVNCFWWYLVSRLSRYTNVQRAQSCVFDQNIIDLYIIWNIVNWEKILKKSRDKNKVTFLIIFFMFFITCIFGGEKRKYLQICLY